LIQSHLKTWQGTAYRHLPQGPLDPLDFSRAGLARDNRWNTQGEPTLYLARHKHVALAEMARHITEDRSPVLARQVKRRQVYRFDLAFHATLDLTQSDVLAALSIQGAPQCFIDKSVARAAAQFVRKLTPAEAIFVPSLAFLDRPENWVLVVFLEKLSANPGFVSAVTPDGSFSIE
jgi:RES domain-containing protein